jgi:hypothetical protein
MAIAVVAIPLAMMAESSFLGPGSLLMVPLLVIAIWYTLSAIGPRRRAWWFGFTVAVGFCLPLCSPAQAWLESLSVYLQRLSQRGTIVYSAQTIEVTFFVAVFIVPVLVAALVGLLAGRTVRSFVRAAPELVESGSNRRHWQFSTRELLIGVAAACLLFGWSLGWSRNFQAVQLRSQSNFLARFKSSFVSGEVKLLAEPILEEPQRSLLPTSRNRFALGVNTYHIVAPIEQNGEKSWAQWAYTCHENGWIFKYGYAEALTIDNLPVYPMTDYIEGAVEMIDGIPATAGPTPTVISVTSPAAVNTPIVLRASAPAGTVCELKIFPLGAVTTPLAPITVGNNKLAQWTWQVGPESAGYSLQYELSCTETRGQTKLVGATRGNIDIAADPAK